MGKALAEAALALGHEVVIVSGPVIVDYPAAARVIPIISTEELLEVCQREFPRCDGVIGAAAPCDYRPLRVETHKITKTGEPLALQLNPTSFRPSARIKSPGSGSSASRSKPTTNASAH
jgi:phosphopantothenoylcysteine decarboxylase/phosphopantothenate--cysteine ligase